MDAIVIIRRKEGYYVIGKATKKHFGGPYKKREDAVNRIAQLGTSR